MQRVSMEDCGFVINNNEWHCVHTLPSKAGDEQRNSTLPIRVHHIDRSSGQETYASLAAVKAGMKESAL